MPKIINIDNYRSVLREADLKNIEKPAGKQFDIFVCSDCGEPFDAEDVTVIGGFGVYCDVCCEKLSIG